jgi:tetratricopeptide (TPR) repeat protein
LDLAGKIDSAAGQVKALAATIGQCAEAGFFRQIRPLATKAFNLLPSLADDYTRRDTVKTLLETLLNLHLDQLVRELAAAIPQAAVRSRALGTLAVLWSKGRHSAEAFQLIRSLKEQPEADDARREIATMLIACGQHAEAVELARASKGSYDKDSILTALADAMSRSGDYTGAVGVAREVSDAPAALTSVCAAMIKANDLEGAWELARSIGNDVRRANALTLVARAFGRNEQARQTEKALDEAITASEKLSYEDFGRVSARIAAVWAELGRYQQAREAAERCHLAQEKLWAYTAVVRADLARHRPELAQPMAELLTVEI